MYIISFPSPQACSRQIKDDRKCLVFFYSILFKDGIRKELMSLWYFSIFQIFFRQLNFKYISWTLYQYLNLTSFNILVIITHFFIFKAMQNYSLQSSKDLLDDF